MAGGVGSAGAGSADAGSADAGSADAGSAGVGSAGAGSAGAGSAGAAGGGRQLGDGPVEHDGAPTADFHCLPRVIEADSPAAEHLDCTGLRAGHAQGRGERIGDDASWMSDHGHGSAIGLCARPGVDHLLVEALAGRGRSHPGPRGHERSVPDLEGRDPRHGSGERHLDLPFSADDVVGTNVDLDVVVLRDVREGTIRCVTLDDSAQHDAHALAFQTDLATCDPDTGPVDVLETLLDGLAIGQIRPGYVPQSGERTHRDVKRSLGRSRDGLACRHHPQDVFAGRNRLPSRRGVDPGDIPVGVVPGIRDVTDPLDLPDRGRRPVLAHRLERGVGTTDVHLDDPSEGFLLNRDHARQRIGRGHGRARGARLLGTACCEERQGEDGANGHVSPDGRSQRHGEFRLRA